ncbi:MAG: glycosyl hydrolase family 88 [Ruminococcaceae bacterium]|nr:glycosyl hydrolase family 88 [Oscillospiraceae bacterium]
MLLHDEQMWVDSIWNKIEHKIKHVSAKTGDKIPYKTINGVFDDRSGEKINAWTNGFWPGIMWLMYSATGDDEYKKIAEAATKKLDEGLKRYDHLHHDMGFMWLISSGAEFKLTGNDNARIKTLFAADVLAARYNPHGKYIRAWNNDKNKNEQAIIIDTMMNLPLLFWSSEQHNDPRYKYVAMDHADTLMSTHVRPDGSVYHVANVDIETGEVKNYQHGGGMNVDSAWTRGLAWAIYGYILCFIHTGETRYMDIAKRISHYFIAALDEDCVPRVDFRIPETPVIFDASAGACAVCGLIELAKNVPDAEKRMYIKWALKILRGLEQHCDWSMESDAILHDCTLSYDCPPEDKNCTLIYGDYFFIEAIYKLKGFGPLFW